MKRKRFTKQPLPDKPLGMDSQAIDALYGLEPVYKPNAGTGELVQFVSIACPYCGETFVTSIDLTNGSCAYVEDCQVCCQPIEVAIEVRETGELQSIHARRQD